MRLLLILCCTAAPPGQRPPCHVRHRPAAAWTASPAAWLWLGPRLALLCFGAPPPLHCPPPRQAAAARLRAALAAPPRPPAPAPAPRLPHLPAGRPGQQQTAASQSPPCRGSAAPPCCAACERRCWRRLPPLAGRVQRLGPGRWLGSVCTLRMSGSAATSARAPPGPEEWRRMAPGPLVPGPGRRLPLFDAPPPGWLGPQAAWLRVRAGGWGFSRLGAVQGLPVCPMKSILLLTITEHACKAIRAGRRVLHGPQYSSAKQWAASPDLATERCKSTHQFISSPAGAAPAKAVGDTSSRISHPGSFVRTHTTRCSSRLPRRDARQLQRQWAAPPPRSGGTQGRRATRVSSRQTRGLQPHRPA